jgi:predicted RNase H-like HicB family nuclease
MENKKIQDKQKLQIIFDDESDDYYIIWKSPVIISSGKTESEALKDFKNAAYSYIDSLINSKQKDIQNIGG